MRAPDGDGRSLTAKRVRNTRNLYACIYIEFRFN